MGRHEAYSPGLTQRLSNQAGGWLESKGISKPKFPKAPRGASLPYFAFVFVASILAVTVVDPYAGTLAAAYADSYYPNVTNGQNADTIPQATVSFARGGYEILSGAAFNNLYVADAGTPDPGSAQAFAHQLTLQLNWGQDQYSCLVKLWNRESNWNYRATNASSGAYGIPQALPGNRMASEGTDWATNPETQIRWGIKYIQNRYKNPCNALVHSNNIGWY